MAESLHCAGHLLKYPQAENHVFLVFSLMHCNLFSIIHKHLFWTASERTQEISSLELKLASGTCTLVNTIKRVNKCHKLRSVCHGQHLCISIWKTLSVKILLYFDHYIVTSFHLARCGEMVQFSMTQGPDANGESDIKLVHSFIFLSTGDSESTPWSPLLIFLKACMGLLDLTSILSPDLEVLFQNII